MDCLKIITIPFFTRNNRESLQCLKFFYGRISVQRSALKRLVKMSCSCFLHRNLKISVPVNFLVIFVITLTFFIYIKDKYYINNWWINFSNLFYILTDFISNIMCHNIFDIEVFFCRLLQTLVYISTFIISIIFCLILKNLLFLTNLYITNKWIKWRNIYQYKMSIS